MKTKIMATIKIFASKARSSMFPELTPQHADWWYLVSWRGILWAGFFTALSAAATLIFTILQFWSAGERDKASDLRVAQLEEQSSKALESAAKAQERTAELEKEAAGLKAQAEADRLARVKLESRIAPRTLTQQQQSIITKRLQKYKSVNGVMMANPSTPESEMFARQLMAPLIAAGWKLTYEGNSDNGMVLHPKGVIVCFPLELAHRLEIKDGRVQAPPGPWGPLVAALSEIGISASAIPFALAPHTTIAITISERE